MPGLLGERRLPSLNRNGFMKKVLSPSDDRIAEATPWSPWSLAEQGCSLPHLSPGLGSWEEVPVLLYSGTGVL